MMKSAKYLTMKNNPKHDPKWGCFDITDEQAERIRNGDIDELNVFFIRNYDFICAEAVRYLQRLQNNFDFSVTKDDVVNATYIDMANGGRCNFMNGANLTQTIYFACLYCQKSSYSISRKINTCYQHEDTVKPHFLIRELERTDEDNNIYYVCDDYETTPSPEDEYLSQMEEDLTEIVFDNLKHLFPEKHRSRFRDFLYGININGSSRGTSYASTVFKEVRKYLIRNYKEVLQILQDMGYEISKYFYMLPDHYEDIYLSYETKKLQKRAKELVKEKAKAERLAKKKTPEQRRQELREYNREYARKRRAKAHEYVTA